MALLKHIIVHQGIVLSYVARDILCFMGYSEDQ